MRVALGNPEIKKRVLEWELTPVEKARAKDHRGPRCRAWLFRVNVQQHLESLPDSVEEMIRKAELDTLEHYPPSCPSWLNWQLLGIARPSSKEIEGMTEKSLSGQPEDHTPNIGIGALRFPKCLSSREASHRGTNFKSDEACGPVSFPPASFSDL